MQLATKEGRGQGFHDTTWQTQCMAKVANLKWSSHCLLQNAIGPRTVCTAPLVVVARRGFVR
eukprot:343074-Alexandrium_andersonii.AAC.1